MLRNGCKRGRAGQVASSILAAGTYWRKSFTHKGLGPAGRPPAAVSPLIPTTYNYSLKISEFVLSRGWHADIYNKEIKDMQVLIMGAAVVVMAQVLFLILEESKRWRLTNSQPSV